MNPVDMASTEISTATTPAIPMTTTEEVPSALRQAANVHGGHRGDLSEVRS